MYPRNSRNRWTLFLFMAAGIVLGSFLGVYPGQFEHFSWLAFGRPFGLTRPVVLTLGVISVTFGFEINFNIGSFIGLLLGIAAYKFSERL